MSYIALLFTSLFILTLPFYIMGGVSLVVVFSFYLMAPSLLFMLWRCLFSVKVGFGFATITIFFILFFYIAPILQLSNNSRFLINTLPVEDLQIFIVNITSAIFLMVYGWFYSLFKKRPINNCSRLSEKYIKSIFPFLMVGSIITSIWGIVDINYSYLLGQDLYEEGDVIGALIKHKLLFVIPFLTFSIYLVKKSGNLSFFIVIILLMMVFLTKNPFFDRRNALGPIYITLICLAFPYLISNTRRFFLFLFFSLLIVFPVSSLLTHHSPSEWANAITFKSLLEEIEFHFINMHYDAWANFVGVVDFVDKGEFQFGEQIMGTFLFYVPRLFWSDKPISSGQALGEYLSQNYNLWFENISCPLPAEGYIDFGIFGVIAYSGLLALYTSRLDNFSSGWGTINKISAIYFSIYLLFVLRGSLLPAFAYGVGSYLAINTLPIILAFLFSLGHKLGFSKKV